MELPTPTCMWPWQKLLVFDRTGFSASVQLLGHARLFVSPWAVDRQAPFSMEFPGKNAGACWHFLLQGIFPTQGLNLHLLHFLHCQADSLPVCPLGSLTLYFWKKWPQDIKNSSLIFYCVQGCDLYGLVRGHGDHQNGWLLRVAEIWGETG